MRIFTQNSEEKKIHKQEVKQEKKLEKKAKKEKKLTKAEEARAEAKAHATYTKSMVSFILINATAWVYLTYLLAFAGKEAIAEQLSITIVQVIIYTFIPYLCKSLFENVFRYTLGEIKKNKFADETVTVETSTESNTDVTNEESVSEETSEDAGAVG